MRRLVCLLLFVALAGTCHAQWAAKVDPRFELTSIVFRLVGAQEYSQCGIPSYAADIDEYFADYAEHPVVSFARQIRAIHSIGYNAVSGTADWLVIEDGHVKLSPEYVFKEAAKADSRWTPSLLRRYVKLLDDFYRETDFQKFYDNHAELYRYAESQLDNLMAEVDPEWFVSFYGKEFGDPDIFIGMCNGPSNYALVSGSRKSGYGIVVGCNSDNNGRPAYNPLFLTIILHELGHNFSNPLSEQYWPEMEVAADIIYPHVAEIMAMQAYADARIVTGEWFNNLCVAMCYREMGSPYYDYVVNGYQASGYVWMRRAVEFMDEFYADRERYPHISDFMPRIVEFYDSVAADYDEIEREYNEQLPAIAEITPAAGSTVSADALPSELVVRFSKPMSGGYGANWVDDPQVIAIPLDGGCYWRDECTLVYPLKTDQLESGKTYGLMLLGWAFVSADGYALPGYHDVTFTVE